MTCTETENKKVGICCPQCGGSQLRTTHTEPLQDGRIRRRKTCRNCGHKLVTYESRISNAKC
jgi:transcriptional regulator NrdR family protein